MLECGNSSMLLLLRKSTKLSIFKVVRRLFIHDNEETNFCKIIDIFIFILITAISAHIQCYWFKLRKKKKNSVGCVKCSISLDVIPSPYNNHKYIIKIKLICYTFSKRADFFTVAHFLSLYLYVRLSVCLCACVHACERASECVCVLNIASLLLFLSVSRISLADLQIN